MARWRGIGEVSVTGSAGKFSVRAGVAGRQAAYSELFFTDCLWPDFGEAEIDAALAAYAQRDRRFGTIQPPALAPEAG